VVGLRRSGLGIGLMLRRTAVLRRSLNQHSGSRTDAPTPLHGFDGGVVHTPHEWRGIASGRPQSRGGVQLPIVGPKQKVYSNFVKFFSKAVGQLSSVSCVSSSPSACIKYFACDEPVYHSVCTRLGWACCGVRATGQAARFREGWKASKVPSPLESQPRHNAYRPCVSHSGPSWS
jgi:hypothetical protein